MPYFAPKFIEQLDWLIFRFRRAIRRGERIWLVIGEDGAWKIL